MYLSFQLTNQQLPTNELILERFLLRVGTQFSGFIYMDMINNKLVGELSQILIPDISNALHI